MIAVITGDIIDSQKAENTEWLKSLEGVLGLFGSQPSDWEVFRGDSFQLRCEASSALLVAFQIKAKIKQLEEVDVRMAIGIGTETGRTSNITSSNGTAFVNSGRAFDDLKKSTFAVSSRKKELNETLNLLLDVGQLTFDKWTVTEATVMSAALKDFNLNQKDLAKKLSKSQSSISEAMNRAGFNEAKRIIQFYKSKVAELV